MISHSDMNPGVPGEVCILCDVAVGLYLHPSHQSLALLKSPSNENHVSELAVMLTYE